MYQDFNMGVGFEFIVDPDSAEDVLSVVEGFGVGASIIGYCEESKRENKLMLRCNNGEFDYSQVTMLVQVHVTTNNRMKKWFGSN